MKVNREGNTDSIGGSDNSDVAVMNSERPLESRFEWTGGCKEVEMQIFKFGLRISFVATMLRRTGHVSVA